MGMCGNRRRRVGNQQAAGHTQMHDPLQPRMLLLRGALPQIEDYLLANPVNAVNLSPLQLGCHQLCRRLEGLGLLAEPSALNAVPTKTLVYSARDSFDLR